MRIPKVGEMMLLSERIGAPPIHRAIVKKIMDDEAKCILMDKCTLWGIKFERGEITNWYLHNNPIDWAIAGFNIYTELIYEKKA